MVQESDAVRGVISLTGQFAALEDNLTARENLMLVGRLRGYGKASAGRVVDRLIDRILHRIPVDIVSEGLAEHRFGRLEGDPILGTLRAGK